MKTTLARRLEGIRPSTLNNILGASARPDIISFAGGLPAMELFPMDGLRAASERVLSAQGPAALQYSDTVGYRPLREYLAEEMGRRGVACTADSIVLTSGAQQVLDLVSRAFLDPGDVVITEAPSYLTAFRVFQACEARCVAAPTDENGIIVEALPELIERYHPKLLYTIPNFQNPSGVTLAAERRPALAALAARYGLLVLEDDPYGQLRYAGKHLPPVKAFDTAGQVMYMGTLSKTVAPGLRVGWIVTEPEALTPLVVFKQVADTMSGTLDQRIAYEYLRTGENAAHVARACAVYKERYEAMDGALHEHMPAGFRWTKPEGGLFLWLTGPDDLDTGALLPRALERKVLYVPGEDFFPDGSGRNCMRLSFSACAPARICEGIALLGALCRDHANQGRQPVGSGR